MAAVHTFKALNEIRALYLLDMCGNGVIVGIVGYIRPIHVWTLWTRASNQFYQPSVLVCHCNTVVWTHSVYKYK